MMRTFSFDSVFGRKILSVIQNYNHEKYWRRRKTLTDYTNKKPLLLKLYYLWYIKRTDAYHKCSFGTNLNLGAKFITPPHITPWPQWNNCWT